MKRLLLILAAFVVVFLSACGAQATVQPTIANTTLNTAESYLMRGDSYSEIQDSDHAIADYNQAIRLKPDYAEAYNNRGYVYYWKYEDAKAITDYNRAIELRPDYAYAYNNRGMLTGERPSRPVDQRLRPCPRTPNQFSSSLY